MEKTLTSFYLTTLDSLPWFAGCLVVFFFLGRFFGFHPAQPVLRKGFWQDVAFHFLTPLYAATTYTVLVTLLLSIRFGDDTAALTSFMAHGGGVVARLPVWLQALLILLLTDIMMYWIHRSFHRRALWRWHAVHHSPQEMDWVTAARFHPINYIPYALLPMALMVTLGFAPAAFILLAPFNIVYSAMVHANLDWTFGPFRYVLASPVFHRWHHSSHQEAYDKNFAPTFPVLDVLFGTFYMPSDKKPLEIGFAAVPKQG
jgi:sterol desaturase/sphingolipid hydroxylase (fatty acid hydroxylase superfamily)